MSKLNNLIGQRFGRLTVVERAANHRTGRSGNALWKCMCDCGGISIVAGSDLKRGQVLSCGCLAREKATALMHKRATKHGLLSGSNGFSDQRLRSIYRAWVDMKRRCYNPKNKEFKNYGARGIGVCEEWRTDFAAFYRGMAKSHAPGLSLERIDNDGNYCKENCRWASQVEQQNNKRNNRVETHQGVTSTIAILCRSFGKNSNTVRGRLRRGWPIEEAMR